MRFCRSAFSTCRQLTGCIAHSVWSTNTLLGTYRTAHCSLFEIRFITWAPITLSLFDNKNEFAAQLCTETTTLRNSLNAFTVISAEHTHDPANRVCQANHHLLASDCAVLQCECMLGSVRSGGLIQSNSRCGRSLLCLTAIEKYDLLCPSPLPSERYTRQ